MRHLMAATALLALVAAVYGASIHHRFVFDDQLLVVENAAVQLPLSQAHLLVGDLEEGIAYRPLRMLSYMVDYRIAGRLDPAVFHASNLVYHAAVTLALYALAYAMLGSFAAALVASALFAVHPLGSEAVAYVSGRRDLLSTLFVLLSLLCWCSLLRRSGAAARVFDRRGRHALGAGGTLAVIGMALFAVLGVAAKEMAIVLPVLALLLWLARPERRTASRGASAGPLLALGISVLALAVIGFWLYAGPLGPRLSRFAGESLAPQPALSLRVVGQYLWLAIFPANLSADYRAHAFALPTSSLDGPSLVAGVAIAIVALAGVVLLVRGSVAGAGLLWFLVALLPVAQIVPYSEVVSEHNAYLAIAGMALAFGAAIAALARRRAGLAVVVAVVVIAVLGVRSWFRTQDWRDNLTLWRATVATSPGSVRGQYNLGISLLADGDLLGAQAALERAVQLEPNDRDVLVMLATLSGRLGAYDRALELASRAVATRRDVQTLTVLGWAELSRGEAQSAVPLFEEAIALGGETGEARRGLARAMAGAGRF